MVGDREDGLVRAHEPEDPDGIVPVSAGEPGRGFCQDIALLAQLPVLTPQTGQLVALARRRLAPGVRPPSRSAC